MGRISGPHGVRGALKVRWDAETPGLSDPGKKVFLSGGRADGDYVIERSQPNGKGLLIWFSGIETREAAQALRGCHVFVDREALPLPEDGEVYWFDLIGLRVTTSSGEFLGELDSIMETGANDVYVVIDRQTGRETLVPALDWVVLEMNLEEGRMVVELPEGL